MPPIVLSRKRTSARASAATTCSERGARPALEDGLRLVALARERRTRPPAPTSSRPGSARPPARQRDPGRRRLQLGRRRPRTPRPRSRGRRGRPAHSSCPAAPGPAGAGRAPSGAGSCRGPSPRARPRRPRAHHDDPSRAGGAPPAACSSSSTSSQVPSSRAAGSISSSRFSPSWLAAAQPPPAVRDTRRVPTGSAGGGAATQSAWTRAASAGGSIDARGLVGDPDLQRPEPRMRPRIPPAARVVLAARRDVCLPLLRRAELGRRAAAGQLEQPAARVESAPDSAPWIVRRVERECEQRTAATADLPQRAQARLEALHADMDVQAADELPACSGSDLLEHLRGSAAQERSPAPRPAKTGASRRPRRPAPRARPPRARTPRSRATSARASSADSQIGRVRLDQAGEELGLQPGRAEQLLDPGRERQRLGVDELQLLLDADRQRPPEVTSPRTACTGRPAASHA